MSLHAQSPERPRSVGATMRPSQPPATLAVRALLGLAAAVAVALIVLAGGYGYHRDELYFLEAGRHLAWAYADQGPLTPLLAHLMDTLSPGSLTVLRVPSALMAGGTVFVAGLTAFELGATGAPNRSRPAAQRLRRSS